MSLRLCVPFVSLVLGVLRDTWRRGVIPFALSVILLACALLPVFFLLWVVLCVVLLVGLKKATRPAPLPPGIQVRQ